MTRATIVLLTTTILNFSAVAAVNISGTSLKVINITPEASSGLNELLVVYDTGGVTIAYDNATTATPQWLKYSNRGGGFAEPVQNVSYNGTSSSITAGKEDCGYIIEDGDKRYYFWVVNYANHYYSARDLTVGSDTDCSTLALSFDGNASPIHYYGINGRQFELSRMIDFDYYTLSYDDASKSYSQMAVKETVASLSNNTVHLRAPLCDTQVTMSGDRFLKEWNYTETITSPSVKATAVEAYTAAEQEARDVPNEKKVEGGDDSLGGSAPCDVTFSATITDAVVFTEWQFSNSSDFEDITLRMNEPVIDYTFRDEGTSYVRFVCANAAGDCEYYSDTYTVSIGASALECPNAFSPGASEGVNDEWRVSYRSIVSFECHIFNRWGKKLASFTNPAQGWDGKVGGKVVPSGVYFYVIKARGADGKEYKLSGDINVVNYE